MTKIKPIITEKRRELMFYLHLKGFSYEDIALMFKVNRSFVYKEVNKHVRLMRAKEGGELV